MVRFLFSFFFAVVLLCGGPLMAEEEVVVSGDETDEAAAVDADEGNPESRDGQGGAQATAGSSGGDAEVESLFQENTLDGCRDGADNDGDGHVDCDDQDCNIYAVCVERPEAAEEPPPAPVVSETPKKGKGGEEIIHRPFSLGFVPGLTTDGRPDGPVRNNFSLNFIGWGDYLKGADVGSLGNIRKRDVEGFQGAGIFNHTMGQVRGFQGAGIYNYANGPMRGLQAAGIATIARGPFAGVQGAGIASVSLSDSTGLKGAGIATFTRGDMRGLEGAGIANVTVGSMKGLQAAGIVDVTVGHFTGFQASGIASAVVREGRGFQASGIASATIGERTGFQAAGISTYALSLRGMQASGIANVAAREMHGAQAAGIVNVTQRARGAQIGLVNIATQEMRGAQVGLINYAGDGILAPVLWGSDNSMLNIGLKMGNRYTYGLLGYGLHPIGGENERRDSFIAGFGGHIEIHPVWLELDLVSHWLRGDFKWSPNDVDYLQKFRVKVGYRVIDQLSLFAGPTLNLLVSETRKEVELIPALWSGTGHDDDVNLSLTLGFVVGLQWEPKWGRLNSSHGAGR